MRRVLVVAIVAGRAVTARADASVSVTLNQAGQQLASYLKLTVPQLVQNAEDKFNELFQTARLPELLRAFAATTAISDRGLGVNYAVKPGELMIGAVANGALASDVSLGSTSHVIGGVVFNVGVMVGAELGRFGLPRWTVFANGFYETGSYHGLDGHLATTAAHVQYRIVPETHPGAVRWIGLDATSGLEYARWTIGAGRMLPINFKVANPAGDSEHLTLNATGTLSVVANTFTVPVEVTTGVRFFDVVALYAGGGVDVTAGSASLDVALAGDMVITSNQENVGTASITANGAATASPLSVHALAGLQINVPYVDVFVQGTISPDVEGVSVGLRLAL